MCGVGWLRLTSRGIMDTAATFLLSFIAKKDCLFLRKEINRSQQHNGWTNFGNIL